MNKESVEDAQNQSGERSESESQLTGLSPKLGATPSSKHEKFRDFVLAESRKGNVVVMGIEGPMAGPLEEFIKQPAEGILYDLNRLPEVVMTFIDDPKWVNDYAVSMVIRRLRETGTWQPIETAPKDSTRALKGCRWASH